MTGGEGVSSSGDRGGGLQGEGESDKVASRHRVWDKSVCCGSAGLIE